MNSFLAWIAIIGMAVVPLVLGMVFEQKLQPSLRELGPRVLRRY